MGLNLGEGLALANPVASIATVGSGLFDSYQNMRATDMTNRANERIANARNAMEREEAQLNRDFSSYEARQNRHWQENMSNTANSGGDYTGDLGAMGTAVANGHGFTKSFVEHGIVIGLMSVRADLTYQQGVPRSFLKKTRYDVYWPSLAHLGEQAVTNAEIFWQNNTIDDDVFGYQERYAEYRYKPSQISGRFRSNASQSLDPWHLSQQFSSVPILGPTFIEENPPLDRVVRFPDEPHFIVDSYTSLKCARPMPVFGVPGLIDHF